MSTERDQPGAAVLEAGMTAPDFKLLSTPDQLVALSELRGAPVILAFYPADFSPVCGDQMALYNQILQSFAASTRSWLVSPLMEAGVMPHLLKTASCIFDYLPILSLSERWQKLMARTAPEMAFANAPCL
jgi:hypothetical protein